MMRLDLAEPIVLGLPDVKAQVVLRGEVGDGLYGSGYLPAADDAFAAGELWLGGVGCDRSNAPNPLRLEQGPLPGLHRSL